jgi:hypothetical protein
MVAVLVLLMLITVCAVHVVISDDDLHAFRHFDVLDDSSFDCHSNDLHGPALPSRFKRVSPKNNGEPWQCHGSLVCTVAISATES